MDFAFLRTGELRVIELNPFSRATHAALFDWEKDTAVLHGQKSFEVRIVTAFDPTSPRRIARSILMRLASVRSDVPSPPEEKDADVPQAHASPAAKAPPAAQEESRYCLIS